MVGMMIMVIMVHGDDGGDDVLVFGACAPPDYALPAYLCKGVSFP